MSSRSPSPKQEVRMSSREHVGVEPVTGVAWTSNTSTCPKNFTLINITEDGALANFTRSFAMRSGYYLCYSKDLSGGMVVSDIQVISEKDSIPHGFSYISEHLEPRATVSKKKRVCVHLVPVGSVDTAVLNVKVTLKNKMMLQHYTCVGDIHGYVLWCKKGRFSSPKPQAKPRKVSLDRHDLLLEQPSAPLPVKPSERPPLPPVKIGRRRNTLNHEDSGITALDGVPFALHPKFDIQKNGTSSQVNTLNNIHMKSLQDIENEYGYTFAVEESAAKRTRPSMQTEVTTTSQ